MSKSFARLFYQEIRLVADKQPKVNYMQKCLLLIALLISTSAFAGLDWNPYVMTHERFVHLSSEDKELVIIKTMEMIVEMEGKYRKAVVENQPHQELYEQYSVLMKKLQNLLISEAYANGDEKFIKRAQQFNSLLSLLKSEACIYAGYVSKLVNGRCTSPSLLTGKPGSKEAKIKAAYLDAANQNGNKSGKCSGPSKISCNPVIFGYKKVDSSVPFCVNTSPSEAHNAAYECMKVALSDNKQDSLTDSKSKRLDHLKALLTDSSAGTEFNKAHKFIFRTCMCDESTGLNPAYTKYMKPHRTCFGMLHTLNSIESKECSTLNSQTAIEAFGSEWTKYYGATSFDKQEATKEVAFDSIYKGILSKPEMQRLCSGNPDDGGDGDDESEGNECSTDCKKETVDGKEVVYCTVSSIKVKKKANGKMQTTEVKEFKEVKLLLEKGKKELTYEGKDGTKYVCAVEGEDEDEGPLACELSADFADPKKPIITLKFNNLKEGQKEPAVTWAGLEGTVDPKDSKIYTATATKEEKTLTATFASEIKDDKNNTCTLVVKEGEAADDGTKYGIKTELKPFVPADITVKVHATVTLPEGKTLPADYQIVWIRKDYKGPKTEVKKPEPTGKAEDTNGTTEVVTPVPPTAPAGEPPVAEGQPGAAEADIDETRLVDVYSTCAQLLDGAKKPVADSCEQIPALEKAPPPMAPGGRPPQFLTPSYNTRTMGVQ